MARSFTLGAATQEGRYAEAAAHAAKVVQANPSHGVYMAYQAISLALAGRVEEARPILARALELEPEFRIRTILELGYAPAIADRFVRGAKLLGARE